jgi:sulfur-oxidizing protein SoxB
MKKNRRDFIKNIGLVGAGVGLMAPVASMAMSHPDESFRSEGEDDTKGEVILNILQTTDVHCQVHPHDELFWENGKAVFRKTGGYAQLSSYLKKERKKCPNTFVIDTGDMFQGSELSVKTTGQALVPILNALKYDLYIPGNWEVIYGKQNMQKLLGALQAPKICANMYHDLGDGKKGELVFQPYYIWHVAGVKIGFVSYTDPMVPLRQSPAYSKGIIYTQPEENVAHFVDVLKNQEACSFVILLSHLGLSQQINLANMEACNGVDYIFGGDTHERVRKPIECKYSKVVEPGAFGSFIGKLQLTIKGGKIVSENYILDELDADKWKADVKMEQLIQKFEKPFEEEINKVIGHSTIPLYRYFVIENPIDTMILSALKWQLPNIDVALSNGFRFCPPRVTKDETGNIPITNGYLYDMLPVDSIVRTAEASGKQIKEWLEKELNNVFAKNAAERFGGWVVKFNGMKVTFNAFGEKGKRVQSAEIGGKPIDPERMYTLCACERQGDPDDVLCRIKGVKNSKNTEFTLHSTMISYLAVNSPVTPSPFKNAVALDAPETLLTQVWGVDYEFK